MPYEKHKQPQEVLDYDIDCTKRLSSDDTIIRVQPSVSGPDNLLVVERSTPIENGTRAKIWLSGGTHMARYKVTVLCVTYEGRTIESEFFVNVKDK